MKRAWLAALGASSVLLVTLVVVAPEASATLVKQPNGHYLSIALPSGVAPTSVPGSVAAARHAAGFSFNGNMDYQGGAVMHSSAPYLIFWTPSGETIPASTETLLERYFTDAAADSGTSSNVYSVLQQYTDGTGNANYAQTFSGGQAIVDTDSYPTTGRCTRTSASHPTCLTDAQLQAEVKNLVADGLPNDGPSATQLPGDAPIYFIVLPSDVNECSSGTQCADNTFCAYHTSLVDGSNYVLYASIPLLPATGKACQSDGNTAVQSPNGDSRADIAIKYMSHEDSETITDPVMACTVTAPDEGCGWWDTNTGQEVGDNCNFYGSFNPAAGTNPNAFMPYLGGSAASGNLYNQLINGDSYYIQSEWSNADVNCDMPQPSASSGGGGGGGGGGTTGGTGSTPGGTGSPSGGGTGSSPGATTTSGIPSAVFNTSPSSPGTGQPVFFNASGSSSGGRSIVAYAWNFGDGTSGSGAKPTHTYRKTGTYTVTLAIGDSAGQMAFVSHKVTVSKAGVTKVSASNKKGGSTVLITTNAPGKLQFGRKTVRVKGAGTLSLRLTLSAARQRTLSTIHRLALLVTVKFAPAVGKRSTKSATIVFRT